MKSSEFEYEVAFSFMADDEPLAVQIADQLRDRYQVFLYSERQKELAGRDGVERFSEVFREKARVCVVLFREGWGKTKWTRVEETAIKDRAFEKGWEFLVVVSLGATNAPAWLPKTKIWFGLDRFGIPGAVAVIEARIQDQGGISSDETPSERATRLARAEELKAERKEFLESPDGFHLAQKELGNLFIYIRDEVNRIKSSQNVIQVDFYEKSPDECVVRSSGRNFVIIWSKQFANSLRQSALVVREFKDAYWGDDSCETRHYFVLDDAGNPAWIEKNRPERLYSTKELAFKYLNRAIEGS
jgi:hypothetical protein